MFMIKQGNKQKEKDNLFKSILYLDKKFALDSGVKNNRNMNELIRLRKRAVNFLVELGEEHAVTN